MFNHLLAQISLPTFSADEVLSPYVFVFYIAFLVAVVLTPVMRRIAAYYNIIDQPDMVRKLHARPVAYLGGVAVFMGWMAGLTMSEFVFMHRAAPGLPPQPVINISIVVGALVIVVLGLIDDIRKISPGVKISGQSFATIVF